MYFSRIQLKNDIVASHNINHLLAQGFYQEHKLIWNFFEKAKDLDRDFLYRRLDQGRQPIYYILSKRLPVADFGIWKIDTKEYKPIINENKRYAFQLRVNPVVTTKPDGRESKKRKRMDVYTDAILKNKQLPASQQRANREILQETGLKWLENRSQKNGFLVNPLEIVINSYQHLTGRQDRKKNKISLGVIDFSGFLTVTDSVLFQNALLEGIGPAKAFGCGLLLLKPA